MKIYTLLHVNSGTSTKYSDASEVCNRLWGASARDYVLVITLSPDAHVVFDWDLFGGDVRDLEEILRRIY